MREALKRLQQAGLVSISQGGATRVRDWRRHGGLELLLDLAPTATRRRRCTRRARRWRCARASAPTPRAVCAQRADAALQAQIVARAEQLAAVEDLDARNAHYEVLWDLIVDGADNIAYRLALTTLVARQRGRLGRRATRSRRELEDADAIRALAAAIAAAERRHGAHARPRPARALDPAVAEVLYYAIPFFVLLLIAEYASFRHLDHDDDDLVGYDLATPARRWRWGSATSSINVGWKLVVVAVYAALYELTPLRLDPHNPLTWVALFFADDLAYYWFHRVSHESRVFWASHVVHHSSQHFNLSTALRQTWVPMTYFPFWLPLPLLGFPVWMVLLAQAWSLIYQFWIHTERIKRLPRWVERIFNTPSHHRVHHGMNHQYLDKNYAGILIIWDRMFGTWEPEGERVTYGLTTQLDDVPPGPGRVPRVHRARARRARARAGCAPRPRCCCAGPAGRRRRGDDAPSAAEPATRA